MGDIPLARQQRVKFWGEKRGSGGIPGAFCTRKHALAYLTLPKSACTTIKNILYFLDNGEYYRDPVSIHGDGIALLKWNSPIRINIEAAIRNRKVVFTFVREPFSRAYSAFNESF